MKAVCSRHEQAYEVGVGCPWCEPVSENPKSIAASVQVEASVLPLFDRALRCAQRNDDRSLWLKPPMKAWASIVASSPSTT